MYKSLQAGRAIAALFVVQYHLGGAIAAEKYFNLPFFGVPFSFGGSGVEFFFVISGFIILTAHRQDIFNPKKLGRYIEKRIVRIYPTYWIIFIGVYVLALSSSALRNAVPHDVFLVLKSLLLVPQDITAVGGTGAPIIIVAWTLQYEILFYSFFAVMILSRVASLIIGLSWLIIYAIGLSLDGNSSLPFPISFLASDYTVLFILGMGVSALCSNEMFNTKHPLIIFLAGVIFFTFVALDKLLKIHALTDISTLLYGIASAIMVFGLVKSEETGQVIGGGKWLQLLGDSSYALYLIHYPLISILCMLSMFIGIDKLGYFGALMSYCVILSLCIVVSVAFHLGIEKPVTIYVRKHLLCFINSNKAAGHEPIS